MSADRRHDHRKCIAQDEDHVRPRGDHDKSRHGNDHQYLVEVFRASHLREAVSALEEHLSHAEVLARRAAAEPG